MWFQHWQGWGCGAASLILGSTFEVGVGSAWALGMWQGPPFALLLEAVPVPPGMWFPCAQMRVTAAGRGFVPCSQAGGHQDPPGSQPEFPGEAAGADVPSQHCAVPAVKAKPAEMLMSGKVTVMQPHILSMHKVLLPAQGRLWHRGPSVCPSIRLRQAVAHPKSNFHV